MRERSIRAWFRGERGGALLYALLAVAAMSIVAMQMVARGGRGQVYVQDDRLKASREKLYRRVNATAAVEDSVFTSLADPSNGPLRQCLTSGSGCASYSPANRIPMMLYSSDGQLVAGTAASPVLYDSSGAVCTANCVFAAYAFFWSKCGVAGCAFPDNIYTLVQIKSTGTTPFSLAVPASLPKDGEIAAAPLTFANKLVASKIVKTQLVCPAGTAQVQYNQGQITCQCIAGTQVGQDANGYPICSTSNPTCPPNQVFIGLNSLGSASCAPVGQTNCYTSQASNVQLCDINGCSEVQQLHMNCGSNGAVAYRMIGYGNQPQGCDKVADPNKKSNANDFGVYRCSFTYNFQCCEL